MILFLKICAILLVTIVCSVLPFSFGNFKRYPRSFCFSALEHSLVSVSFASKFPRLSL